MSVGAEPPDVGGFAPGAVAWGEGYAERFRRMLWASAKIEARRRGATSIDNTDLDSAWRSLVLPGRTPLSIVILDVLFVFVSGLMTSVGVNYLTSEPAEFAGGYWIAGGVACFLVSLILRQVHPRP